ncbi:hypothetical protein QJS10_CPA16g00537 [Acorus calamus]|uniref:Uncharacterized protein n=1 Tax=Acorus calamus TaxID=4465 RepID=A0AAV9D298_ACOCL|nr:hypothetical protein QJS10_CPA16g00537 [Acorus calamus]
MGIGRLHVETFEYLERLSKNINQPPHLLKYYTRGPRKRFRSSLVETARTEVNLMTPVITATSPTPPDASSSLAPPAPRKPKQKGLLKRILR